jgi:hypothetical protein
MGAVCVGALALLEDRWECEKMNLQTADSVNAGMHSAEKTKGGDVEFGQNIDAERMIISTEDLVRLGHKSVDDFIRSELSNSQGAVAGYNAGVDAVSTLHVGLTDEGRRAFKDARKPAIEAFYASSGEVLTTDSGAAH